MGEETNVGFMDKLAVLIQEFDPAALLPKLDDVMGWVELAVRTAVMIAPLVILALGLCYMLFPPKEANHRFGYRCFFGMGSVEAWQYTQRLAGLGWTAVGLVLTVVMLLICEDYRGMESMDMVNSAVVCLVWQGGAMLVLNLLINLLVLIRFNRKGERRGKGKGLQIPDLTVSGMIAKIRKPKKKRTPGKKTAK